MTKKEALKAFRVLYKTFTNYRPGDTTAKQTEWNDFTYNHCKNGVKHPSHTCVEAFIDRQTGDIYKPAGWNKPAKGARYNLLDEESLQLCFRHLDPFGGHLYKNRGVI